MTARSAGITQLTVGDLSDARVTPPAAHLEWFSLEREAPTSLAPSSCSRRTVASSKALRPAQWRAAAAVAWELEQQAVERRAVRRGLKETCGANKSKGTSRLALLATT